MTNKTERNGLTLLVNFSVIALCLALSLNMFVTGLPQKIFYFVSYLSVASILYGLVRRRIDFRGEGFYLALFAVLVIFTLIRLFWALHVKGIETAPSTDAITNIGNYLLGAKRLLLGAFILLSLAIYGDRVSLTTLRIGKVLILIGLLITLGFGIHEHLYTANIRIKLTTEAASMSSYMILFIYCAWLWLSRFETHRYWKVADVVVLAVTFALLYLCATRVTLIALIATGLLFVVQSYRLSLLTNWRVGTLAVGVVALLILMTSNRWVEGVQDIENFGSNSSTSLGARVAIWSGAMNFIEHHSGFANAGCAHHGGAPVHHQTLSAQCGRLHQRQIQHAQRVSRSDDVTGMAGDAVAGAALSDDAGGLAEEVRSARGGAADAGAVYHRADRFGAAL